MGEFSTFWTPKQQKSWNSLFWINNKNFFSFEQVSDRNFIKAIIFLNYIFSSIIKGKLILFGAGESTEGGENGQYKS